MTIRELIEELKYAAELMDEDAEVRYAAQPSWPFEYSIRNVIIMTKENKEEALKTEMKEEGKTSEEINKWLEENNNDTENVVYLEEGSQLGYLPNDTKQELGW